MVAEYAIEFIAAFARCVRAGSLFDAQATVQRLLRRLWRAGVEPEALLRQVPAASDTAMMQPLALLKTRRWAWVFMAWLLWLACCLRRVVPWPLAPCLGVLPGWPEFWLGLRRIC